MAMTPQRITSDMIADILLKSLRDNLPTELLGRTALVVIEDSTDFTIKWRYMPENSLDMGDTLRVSREAVDESMLMQSGRLIADQILFTVKGPRS